MHIYALSSPLSPLRVSCARGAVVCKLVLMIMCEVVYYRQLLVLLHGRYAACALPLIAASFGTKVIHAVDAIIYNVLRRTSEDSDEVFNPEARSGQHYQVFLLQELLGEVSIILDASECIYTDSNHGIHGSLGGYDL